MTDIVICVSTNIFRIYLISRFINVFLKDEEYINDGQNINDHRHLMHGFAYICFFLVNTAAYLIFHMAVVNFLCNLVGM